MEKHDYEGDAAECPACLEFRRNTEQEPDVKEDGEVGTVGVELPESRTGHHLVLPDFSWPRLGLETRGWVTGPDDDQQAGDSALLYDKDKVLRAAGVIEHVARPGLYRGLKKGCVIMTIKDIRPARFAPAEASE